MKRLGIKIGWVTVLIFCLYSCTKFGKNVTIEGQVLNPVTNKPISGIKIYLFKSDNFSGYYGGYKSIKETTTGEDGHFELSAGRIGTVWAGYDLENQKYYALGWDYNGPNGKFYKAVRLKKGHTMHVNCYMVPYGKYKLKIQNVNCQGVNDTIIINQTNQVGSFLDKDWVLTGCDGYTTSWNKTPMGNIHTVYTVIRGGVSNTYTQDFEVKPNQNNIQVISY